MNKFDFKINRSSPFKVALVGCGGTGSVLLTQLTRIHLANKALGGQGLDVVAVDGDRVSESNIGRQCFYPMDVGHPKASVLIERVNAAYGLNWSAHVGMLTPNTSLTPFDLVISCVDTVKARRAIKIAMDIGGSGDYIHWMDCGNTQNTGQVVFGGGFNPRLPTVLDLYPNMEDNEVDSGPSCSLAEAIASQDLFVNTTVATAAAQLLWKLLRTGSSSTHGVFINLETGKQTPLNVDPGAWLRMGFKYEE